MERLRGGDGGNNQRSSRALLPLLLLLVLVLAVVSAVSSAYQQQQQQQQQQLQQSTTANSADLDNSISVAVQQQADIAASRHHQGANSQAAAAAAGWWVTAPSRADEESAALATAVPQLERRIDRLEFELRKALHNQQHQTRTNGGGGGGGGSQSPTTSGADELAASKWASLAERLELVEKFIAITTTKLYETEQRVRQLEKCDCKLSCKWRPPPSGAQATTTTASAAASTTAQSPEAPTIQITGSNDRQQRGAASSLLPSAQGSSTAASSGSRFPANETTTTVLVKMDGESWTSKCDVCSCHRGHVTCRYVSCPELRCADPHHVAGKCCPVCYKPCVYKTQTVRHGNKLVINSNQDTCKECMCIDGRFKCQRAELAGAASAAATTHHERATHEAHTNGDPPHQRATRVQRSELDNAIDDNDDDAADDEYDDYSNGVDYDDDDDGERNLHPEAAPLKWAQLRTTRRSSGVAKQQTRRYSRNAAAQRRKQRHPSSSPPTTSELLDQPPLVCPLIADCKPEDQIRLANDCCTYCRGFDFCAHKARHQCHPSAFCINANSATVHTQHSSNGSFSNGQLQRVTRQQQQEQRGTGTTGGPTLVAGPMFSCHCRTGFTGDGRFCRDIDECADRRLNHCDPMTTVCVNLAGSYECRCRRGFRPTIVSGEQQTTTTAASVGASDLAAAGNLTTVASSEGTHALIRTATPMTEQDGRPPRGGQLRVCADINECADARLNRCHPQARCINSRGSYKCHCKRGYLGNGFECHKWLSSDPNVAAYLHRHAGGGTAATAAASNGSGAVAPPPPVSKPLGTLNDPDDDQTSDERLANEDGDDVDEDQADEQASAVGNGADDAGQRASTDHDDDDNEPVEPEGLVPKLSESKWEPLRFELSLLQQPDNSANQAAMPTATSSTSSSSSSSTTKLRPNANNLNRASPQAAALNTRTMFFQPSPRFWQENVTNTRSTTTSTATNPPVAAAGSGTALRTNNQGKSDTNDPVYIQRSSQTVSHSQQQQQQNDQRQHQTTSLASPSSETPPTSAAAIASDSQPGGPIITTPNNHLANNSPGYKRGTIIASATTSSTRGHSSRGAHSQYYKSKALGVTSSSSSSAASSVSPSRRCQIISRTTWPTITSIFDPSATEDPGNSTD